MVYFIVGAYQSRDTGIILNATATNQIGVNASTNRIYRISPPDSINSLLVGEQMHLAFQACFDAPQWNEEMSGNLPDLLGFKTRSKFNKEHLHVVIEFLKEKGIYQFTPTKIEGSGYVNNGSIKFEMPESSTLEQLGNQLLEAFKLCKK